MQRAPDDRRQLLLAYQGRVEEATQSIGETGGRSSRLAELGVVLALLGRDDEARAAVTQSQVITQERDVINDVSHAVAEDCSWHTARSLTVSEERRPQTAPHAGGMPYSLGCVGTVSRPRWGTTQGWDSWTRAGF